MLRRFALIVCALLAFMVTVPHAMAQLCGGRWLPEGGASGVTGQVNAVANWDPDGAGPRESIFVIAGDFYFPYSRIAGWDARTGEWVRFPFSSTGSISCLLPLANGDLVIGGDFTNGAQTNHIARFNHVNQSFQSIGQGLNGVVFALARLADGGIVAGGSFTIAGGNVAFNVAQWDESTQQWGAMGTGLNGVVRALTVLPNGDVIAGGTFTSAGNVPTARLARWNPSSSSWSAMGSGASSTVQALLTTAGGDVIACGLFTSINGVGCRGIARYDPVADVWSPLGLGLGLYGYAAAEMPNGDVVVGGLFNSAGGQSMSCIARWSDRSHSWSNLGTGVDIGVGAVAANERGDLLIAGGFRNAGSVALGGVAVWRDGAGGWHPLGTGFDGMITKLSQIAGGDIVAAGFFSSVGGVHATRIARWSASTATWSDMSNGIPSTCWNVQDVEQASSGRLLAAVNPYSVPPGAGVYEWFEGQWHLRGSSLDAYLYSVAALADERIVCGGYLRALPLEGVATLDPVAGTWSSPGGGIPGSTYALLSLTNSDFVAGYGGVSGRPNYGVLRWVQSAQTWIPLGGGLGVTADSVISFPVVTSLARYSNGDIVAGGGFAYAGGLPARNIARWHADTDSWSAYGSGVSTSVNGVAVLPSGDLVVSSNATANRGMLGRWSETTRTWVPFGDGFDDAISDVIAINDHWIAVGGRFTTAGSDPSAAFARYQFFDAPPAITLQPRDTLAWQGDSVELAAAIEPDFEGVTLQWYRDGSPITDGPGGGAADGGVVSGASRSLASPSDSAPITLSISGAKPEDSGAYHAVFTSACGTSTSLAVEVRVCPACAADYDSDGGVTASDVGAFFMEYEEGGGCADVDRDGGVTFSDVAAFFSAFEAGAC